MALKAKLSKYFSGKLAVVQITAGVGAFAGRSAATYIMIDQTTWSIVIASQFGSFTGYIVTYIVGYWIAFRADYRQSARPMGRDIFKLELVEQFPSVAGAVPAVLTQAGLLQLGVAPIISVNMGSWFGPQKIINWIAMISSNSLKRAWVDGTWSLAEYLNRLKRFGKR